MDITLIPSIMRRKGWHNGARLLEIWFSRAPNNIPEFGVPETATIRMDTWALTFPRAKQVYQDMVNDRVWCNEAARQEIARMLRRRGLLKSQRTTFGDFTVPVPDLDEDFVNQRTAGSALDPLDDMYAALGKFCFRVAIQASVEPPKAPGGRHSVNIHQVGFYIWDRFDFNGDQPLGFWSSNDVSRFPLPGYDLVENADFRKWRQRHGRGGDFVVYSDLKVLKQNPPQSFLI